MRSDNGRGLKTWQKALIVGAGWTAVNLLIKLLADTLLNSILLHVAYVMILSPAITLIASFMFTRKCGLKAWLPCVMAVGAAVLYIACGFKTLSPNFLIETAVCGFFGFGTGNIFKDEVSVAVQEDRDSERKKREQEREKRYVSVLKATEQDMREMENGCLDDSDDSAKKKHK